MAAARPVTRLRRVSPADRGWRRVARGRGFSYLDGDRLLDGPDRDRCVQLVIPPAWTDVWICPHDNGHLQAVGTDAAGRRQYLYHPSWRERRDREKYLHMLEFAERLPRARARVRKDAREGDGLQQACALAFSMLDVGAFRIGSDRYTEENGSHGLLTLERRHVRLRDGDLHVSYVGKSGQEQSVVIVDPGVLYGITRLRARRAAPDAKLLAHKTGGRWCDLTTEQFSAYLKDVVADDATAKDFRTWRANVFAAAAFAVTDATTPAARRRAVAGVMRQVADGLGNTPAVARSGYVDPRLVDLFEEGTTVGRELAARWPPRAGAATRPALERAVHDLLAE
ncbi:hypothetical protein HMPREF0063_10126 [Aeromicrobium marinum DSM 15272]|uniref:DNA topoisomerase n=1 Tax=Aeromicrobium marinum DSM 15272 TaxID=585531 RepID=E2S7W9_9ACTN|nr:hypothetical protein HMPREF0063_10126 [Aeromicrobium marinum DSM 15272]